MIDGRVYLTCLSHTYASYWEVLTELYRSAHSVAPTIIMEPAIIENVKTDKRLAHHLAVELFLLTQSDLDFASWQSVGLVPFCRLFHRSIHINLSSVWCWKVIAD